MKNLDGSIPVPEEHKVTAMQLFIEMDMLEFEYICLKVQLLDAAKAHDYAGYRRIQRQEIPTSQMQHRAALLAFWGFLKECIPDITLTTGSTWDFDPVQIAAVENKRKGPAAGSRGGVSESGLILPDGM